MALRYEVSAKIGTYTAKDGTEKGEYVNMGVVMDTKNGGLMMKLKSIPVGWDGFAYLNTPRAKDGSSSAPEQKQEQKPDDSDQIPF